ncbi:MAG: sugar ABC transporter permease [Streptococcus orisratti]|uniref:carbohydrate ABC transporter permease n=1 Tax=Streptococcus TaxID=1301 RepID=UPI002357DBF7|nr:sugar ABC transporter permease [Streptococcus orisratti]MCI7678315.1 sugar ABC transporter permease [Streptococcus orisratti]MDY4001190.1 sugar ABC transporter permease [Streptococcus orisratti]MDY5635643.1 sugar ABC transporter permease [Streptococcus orisratti]
MNNSVYFDKVSVKEALKKGGLDVKLSALIMGFANLANKQFIKGFLFLISEILFLISFVLQVIPGFGGLITLGTQAQGKQTVEIDGVKFTKAVDGDNSMLLLIFGLASVIFCLVFAYIYWCNLKSARNIYVLKSEGKKIPTFMEDFHTLADGRFHMTLMSIPMIGVLLFTILPLVYMICLAFTSYDHNHLPPKSLFDWVGLSNFGNVLSGRMAGTFFPVLSWTLIWAVAATATNFFFGIVLALIINTKGLKLKKMWRTIFVITIAVPQFISLLIMRNLLTDGGPLNSLLINIGLVSAKNPLPFLTDPVWAKFSIIVVNMWVGIPFTMLLATSIIMNLPQEQLEAAEIDGANKFQIFRNITFPQILLIMMPNLIQQFIGNINNFNVIYLLTGGNPTNPDYYQAGSTDLLVTWLYKLTVSAADYNLASVVGILIFAISAIFSLLAYTRTNSYKEGAAK